MSRFLLIEIGLLAVATVLFSRLGDLWRFVMVSAGLLFTYSLWIPLLRLARSLSLLHQQERAAAAGLETAYLQDRESAFGPASILLLTRMLPLFMLLGWFLLLFFAIADVI